MHTPLYDWLLEYVNEKWLRLHMPGHIGGPGFAHNTLKALAEFDVTEIQELDDLHAPRGVIEEARRLLAKAYGAQESFFLVNGASSGIHALFMALQKPGAQVLVPRNCHRSFFAGMIMAGINPVYIPCQLNDELGIALSVTPDDVEKLLGLHHDAEAVFIVSPSYYGTGCKIKNIADICAKHQKPLLVDEAHGGHFRFHPVFPRPALEEGAMAAVNGLHKTLPVYNQGAVLHTKNYPHIKRLRAACSLLTTTSPSYPILASIDLARDLMEERGYYLLENARITAGDIRKKINKIQGLKAYQEEDLVHTPGVLGLDYLKIIISLPGLRLNGFETARILRDEYRIQVEDMNEYSLLAMISMFHKPEDGELFVRALQQIADKYYSEERWFKKPEHPPIPECLLSPRQAYYAPKKRIALKDCRGKIAGEMVVPYPPGIPCLLPGELINAEMYDYLLYLQKSPVRLQGPEDLNLKNFNIIEM